MKAGQSVCQVGTLNMSKNDIYKMVERGQDGREDEYLQRFVYRHAIVLVRLNRLEAINFCSIS